MKLTSRLLGAALFTMIAAGASLAATGDDIPVLQSLQHEWAKANYGLKDDEREAALKALVPKAEAAVSQFPQSAPLLAWRGIIMSTYAGAKGGLGALDLAKSALKSLEAARKIDEKAIGGGIDTSIGALYYRVPGWPLGFGDDDKAADYLAKGVALNPDGIDENYFYGDYLAEQGEKDKAKTHLEKALAAAPRPGREDADAGRRAEINAVLKKIAD
jgi:tetratricopeptide (TPR) repeat protein